MRLFSVVIDFDCQFDTRDIYKDTWGSDYLKFYKILEEKETRFLDIQVGGSFTMAITKDFKIYSWGLNDYDQLARPKEKKKIFYPPKQVKSFGKLTVKTLSCGDEHCLLVDSLDNIYAWGSNINGQLGLGHSHKKNFIMKLKHFDGKIKTVVAKGRTSYALTEEDGVVWKWPGLKNNSLSPLPLNSSVKIINISCGFGFLMAIGENGLLFSCGNNNKGQLGLGDKKDRKELSVIEKFKEKNESVLEISCGFLHSICKAASGRVYTWGEGSKGQLGNGSNQPVLEPHLVNPYNEKKRYYKAISVQAGFSISYILNDDLKVYFTGGNSTQGYDQLCFTKLNYEKKVVK